MNKFKQFWKGQTYHFSAEIKLKGGAPIVRNFMLVSNSAKEALDDANDALKRDFKYHDVEYINVKLV